MLKSIMLDIETFSTGTNAAIVSIGAVPFDPDANQIAHPDLHFHRRINLAKSKSPGVIDPSTVEWWLSKSEEARTALVAEPRTTLEAALEDFSMWVGRFTSGKSYYDETLQLWSLPPTFDERIVREAYDRNGLRFPFHYRASADMRTLFKLANSVGIKVNVTRQGTHHDALDDALHQARTVNAIFAEFRAATVLDRIVPQ